MQEKKIEVSTIRKYGLTYNIHWMNTLIFDDLPKTCCGDFLGDVKPKMSELIKEPALFSTAQSIVDFMNLYMSYKYTGLWDAQKQDARSTSISLATALKK